MNLLAVYGFIVLAFVGGFFTCAILCFGKRGDGRSVETANYPEIDEHA
ncbi:MAG: hypothetical protein ACYCW7_18535 [Pseudomonadaceae bacterium]